MTARAEFRARSDEQCHGAWTSRTQWTPSSEHHRAGCGRPCASVVSSAMDRAVSEPRGTSTFQSWRYACCYHNITRSSSVNLFIVHPPNIIHLLWMYGIDLVVEESSSLLRIFRSKISRANRQETCVQSAQSKHIWHQYYWNNFKGCSDTVSGKPHAQINLKFENESILWIWNDNSKWRSWFSYFCLVS